MSAVLDRIGQVGRDYEHVPKLVRPRPSLALDDAMLKWYDVASAWRNDNELWETVWAKNGDEDATFRPWPIEGSHRPTFCVWELGAVCHERLAWTRYLCSRRDASARRAYLLDTYEGAV